jgi:TPR repeat protein
MKATLSLLCIGLCTLISSPALAQEGGLVETLCPEAGEAWRSGGRWRCNNGYVLDSSEDSECDEEGPCCVYSGPMKYDIRGDDDYDMEFPVGAGRCVRGQPNGTWTSKKFLIDEEAESPTNEVSHVATGRYTMGLPVGAHVVKHQSMVVEAACYKRTRHREDGEVSYQSETVWYFDLKESLPEEPAKPVLEDFMEDLEKPEMDNPEKPLKEDYDSRSDYREALRDYAYELREAKATFREETREYKKQYREMLPEARSSLREALGEYRDSLGSYKWMLKEVKKQATVLARLAKACPKVTNDYCVMEDSCSSDASCAYHYDREAGEGGCVAKTNAHCRQSDLCKEQGKCTHSSGECVASQAADCEASSRCKERGECTAGGTSCVDACQNTQGCNARGECGWARREGQICEPKTDSQCSSLAACKEKGYCSRVTCKNKGGCTLAGLPTVFGATRCAAGQESDCRATALCSSRGLCSVQTAMGTCHAVNERLCTPSSVCKTDGRCSVKNGQCVVAKDADCAKTNHCTKDGKCSAADQGAVGTCVIGKDADCEKLWVCLRDGRCSYDAQTKACVVGKSVDCASSLACWSAGRCTAEAGQCVIGSNDDCAKAPGCYDGEKCSFVGGASGSERCALPGVDTLKTACKGEDWSACTHLARRYQRGEGVKLDLEKASDLYDDACDEDYGPACVALGLNYLNGRGVSFDLDDALEAFEDGCKYGDKQACAAQASMLAKRWGGKAKPAKVEALYVKGCDGTSSWLCANHSRCTNTPYGGAGCERLSRSRAIGAPRAQEYLMKAYALYERDCEAGYGSQCIAWAKSHRQMNCRIPSRNHTCESSDILKEQNKIFQKACDLGERAGCVALGRTYKDVDEKEPAGPIL